MVTMMFTIHLKTIAEKWSNLNGEFSVKIDGPQRYQINENHHFKKNSFYINEAIFLGLFKWTTIFYIM